MEQALEAYSALSFGYLPESVLYLALLILCLGCTLLLMRFGFKRGLRYSLALLLAIYVVLLYCSTVFFRPPYHEPQYNLIPFWSYFAIVEGKEDLLSENLLNLIVFVPIGLLLGFIYRKGWLFTLMIGAGLSVGIEFFQFVLMRGFSEVDDVLHNTLGCMLGYGLAVLLSDIG
jgi:glycopeptide antibiotics resistance protein